jgi:hypothetical protein
MNEQFLLDLTVLQSKKSLVIKKNKQRENRTIPMEFLDKVFSRMPWARFS